MFTASVFIDQQLARREFSNLCDALSYVCELTSSDLCVARVHSDVMCGAGLSMFVNGAYVSIARLN